jgi:hypothetical protein
VQQLALAADVSIGLVSKVKQKLIEEAYLEERNRLLQVRDAAKLLQDWAAHYRPRVKPVQLFATTRPADTEVRIAEWCRQKKIAYAFTQLSGAWRYAPMVRYDRSIAYIDKIIASEANLTAIKAHIDAREVDSGANCILWITDDPAVFIDTREINAVNVVAPIQLYLDLKVLPGRGEEAAQEILEKQLPGLLPGSPRDNALPSGGK